MNLLLRLALGGEGGVDSLGDELFLPVAQVLEGVAELGLEIVAGTPSGRLYSNKRRPCKSRVATVYHSMVLYFISGAHTPLCPGIALRRTSGGKPILVAVTN